MMDLKTRLSALLTYDGDDESESLSDNSPEKNPATESAMSTAVESDTAYSVANTSDEATLYEASAGQIDAWHVWREFLRKFLHHADWLLCAKLYNGGKIKVGLDRNKQRAIFAIDDTHFYAFDFDEVSGQPKNPAHAYRVLLKLNSVWDSMILCGIAGIPYRPKISISRSSAVMGKVLPADESCEAD